MQLMDFLFLFAFLPAALICAALTGNRPHARNALLLAMSVLFCAASGLPGLLAAAIEILAAFFFGRALERAGEPKRRKCILALGIVFAAGLLCYFKYTNFILQTLRLPKVSVLPAPVGVSFLTFLLISYLADVYRGRIPAETRFSRFFLYALYFPKAAQGPLCRYGDFSAQLDGCTQDAALPDEGVSRLILGLGKKVLLSGAAGAVAKDAFGLPAASLTPVYAWAGAVCYAMQLYFDFSGYSDMALGLGLLFGVQLPENFRHPYCAGSVSEFWRRWHMTLSGWFRDYVYIPLGGSRNGRARTVFNKLLVFLATGLWHGTGWTFVLWGLWHGAFCGAETLLDRNKTLKTHWYGHVYTLLVVIFGFVLFRAESLPQALMLLRTMLSGFTPVDACRLALRNLLTAGTVFWCLAGVLACLPLWEHAKARFDGSRWLSAVLDALTIVGLLLCLMQLASHSFQPFIYASF